MKKNRLIQRCLLIIAVLGIIDTIVMSKRSGGMDVGILLPAVGGVCIIFGVLFAQTKVYKKNQKIYSKIYKLIIGLFTVWFISFVVLTAIIMTSAVSQPDEQVECVFVLGAGLKGDKPTLVLKERLDNTLKYFEKNPEVKIIVSGGQGFGETITEAEGMKRYLVGQGIPEASIIKEERATSTYENMLFSKKLYESMYQTKLNKVMLITNNFHMSRSKLLAKRAGLEPYGISSGTPFYIYPNVLLREYLATFKSLIFDK